MASEWKRRAVWIGCLLAGLLSCQADGEEAPDGDVEVSESDLSAKDAEALFFEVLGGQTQRRAEAIRALKSAVKREPNNARAHLLYALARTSALAEDEDVRYLPFIDREFEAAQRLDPSDRRIPGWRLPVRLQVIAQPYVRGLKLLRPQLDQRATDLEDEAKAFPQFAGFPTAMMFAALPHDTGYPQRGRAWVDLLSTTKCTPEFERFCTNTPRVPHNVEGMRLTFGDVYARAGDVAKAKKQYELALAEPTAAPDKWRLYGEARDRLDNVADRVARWNDADRKNDPAFFHEGKTACVGCHGR